MTVPALSVNKVCLSGLTAVALADHLIRAGLCEVVVAGGMESMSRAPHLLPGSRTGKAYGDQTLVDHLAHDGLWDSYTDQAMGALTEQHNVAEDQFTRTEQDAYSVRSHQAAARAWADGVFTAELAPVTVPGRRRSDAPVTVTHDEGVRADTTLESLARLRPAFGPEGTITAGSASQISDGAAAVVVMSERAAERLGARPLARIGAYAQVAGPDSSLQRQPAAAIAAAAAKAGLDPAGFDRYEINEAFAAVALASTRALGLDAEAVAARVNVHGGAIALGHPIGASGARLITHLAHQLDQGRAATAVAALCGGGGQGDALILTGV